MTSVIGANFFGIIPGVGTDVFTTEDAKDTEDSVTLRVVAALTALTRDRILVVFSISFRK